MNLAFESNFVSFVLIYMYNVHMYIFGLFDTCIQFASRKMGKDELSNQAYQHFRVQLEREIDSLQSTLKQVNENNRPEPYKPSRWVRFRDSIFG